MSDTATQCLWPSLEYNGGYANLLFFFDKTKRDFIFITFLISLPPPYLRFTPSLHPLAGALQMVFDKCFSLTILQTLILILDKVHPAKQCLIDLFPSKKRGNSNKPTMQTKRILTITLQTHV